MRINIRQLLYNLPLPLDIIKHIKSYLTNKDYKALKQIPKMYGFFLTKPKKLRSYSF